MPEVVVHMEIKVDRQLRKRVIDHNHQRQVLLCLGSLIGKRTKELVPNLYFEPFKTKEVETSKDKGKFESPTNNRDIKCFRCHSRGQ